MQISEYISGHHYALCICEGRAEEDLINYLLDHDRLIFKRRDMIFGKVTRSRGVNRTEARLNLNRVNTARVRIKSKKSNRRVFS